MVAQKLKTLRHRSMIITVYIKATTAGDLLKKLFLKISQYLQENNCVEVTF